MIWDYKMKTIYTLSLYLMLSLFSVSMVYAANETRSLRTATGQIVSVGDRFSQVIEATNQTAHLIQSYEWKENKNRYTANVYHYEDGNSVYNITVVNNEVKKIEWFRK